VFSGRGSGHGVGMCQYGAKGMAEAGWDYRRILQHYFSGAEITRMY
jgi:stage II sporulation protein D